LLMGATHSMTFQVISSYPTPLPQTEDR